MATAKVEVTFELDDYFSKFGFGDGDDGAAVDLGYRWRDAVVEQLNKGFKKYKLPIVARAVDYGSMHNQCLIEANLVAPMAPKARGDVIDLEATDWPQLDAKQKAKLKAVLAKVDVWLDTEVS
jgi:hypothetical protein